MPAKLTIEAQIKRAENIHNNYYTYDNYVYSDSNTSSFITCPIHGDFLMSFSNHSHKTKPQGCKKCTFLLNREKLIERSNKLHNNKYDYSLINKEIKSTEKIKIICPKHGVFELKASKHYTEGQGCKKCSQLGCPKLDDQVYINRLLNYKYEIKSELVDLKSTKELEVICKKHGVFHISVAHAVENRGCPTCAIEYRKNNLTFSKKNFRDVCLKNNNGLGIFYILRCFNEEEEFYKLGITSRSIEQRYNNKTLMPYDYEIIQEITDVANNIYNLEKICIKILKKYKYTPNIYFPGSKLECIKYF